MAASRDEDEDEVVLNPEDVSERRTLRWVLGINLSQVAGCWAQR